ncbi:MAG: LLM class flavin-dependent oxidoreductase [Miltoncostaeaceae bacterium]
MRAPRLSVGLRLPEYGTDWPGLRDAALRAERLGFESLWLNDHFQTPGRETRQGAFEVMTGLAALAEATNTARLGTAVLSASYRYPAVAARMVSAIDAISGGRLIVGVGTGSDRPEHRAYGIPFGTPRERTASLLQTLDVLRAMFADPKGATVSGVIEDAPNLPPPAVPGGPPVWVAAHRPRLLRAAGERADGIVAAFLSPEDLAQRLATAEEARMAAGRAEPLACCLYCYCLPLGSPSEIERLLGQEAEAVGTTPRALVRWLRTVGVVGSPEEVRDRLDEYAAAGATHAVLVPPNLAPPDVADAIAEATVGRAVSGDPPAPRRVGDIGERHNLVHLLVQRHRDEGRGADPAVADDRGEWTYDELAEAAARAAGALARAGVRRGERVAVLLRDGRPWLAAFLGAASLGAVPVPLDPLMEAGALAAVLDDCEPWVVVADPLPAALDRLWLSAAELEEGTPLSPAAVHLDDLAYLVYSSGSTGLPKGAMHAHRDMRTSLEGFVPSVLGLGPGERTFSVPRLFTSLGFGNGFFRALGSGATAVMSSTTPTARSVIDIVERHGITVLTGVPTFWSQLARFLERRGGGERLAGVRIAFSSGDALPPAVRAHLREAGGLELIEGLGCSECSNVVIAQRPGEAGEIGTLGVPVPGVEVRLVDESGSEAASGEPGRLWIRSDSNTSGYWRRSSLTRDLVHGEWLRMGDVLSEVDGVYRHLGRADDLFKVDARWVSPAAVEGALLDHPDIVEAAVAGVPDDRGLMRVAAFVVTVADVDPEALADRLRVHVADALAPHSAPQSVRAMESLPRLPSGKLDRRALLRRG